MGVMRILIDTSGYSAFKRGNPAVTKALQDADEVIVPIVVLGELHAGFAMGSHTRKNEHELHEFLASPSVTVQDVDHSVAERYGAVVKTMRLQGTPIPTNDLWIAACALETGARILSLDAHFEKVPGMHPVPL
jgi:tRNA(fMet)-specific endonuclease VapC